MYLWHFLGDFLALHVDMFLALELVVAFFFGAFFDMFVQQGSLVTTNHRLG